MDIADVAKKAGVPASTLRFYEKRGLMASVGPQGVRRQFAPGVLDQLAALGAGAVAELPGKAEDMVFALPKELRIALVP